MDLGELKEMGAIYVKYSIRAWRTLRDLRSRALRVIKPLVTAYFEPIVYGSVARGDVDTFSDVDIAILRPVPPYLVEEALRRGGFEILYKEVIRATPQSAPKVYLHLEAGGEVIVSFPLVKLSDLERDFYKFGGEVNYEELIKGTRVPGVNKSLRLIVPVTDGHLEFPLVGNEEEASKLTGIPLSIIREREVMLMKRRTSRRGGVYYRKLLGPDEPIEELLRELISGKY